MPVKRKVVAAFKPHNQGLAKLFGSLEADIMDLLWTRHEASARDVFEELRSQGQRLSYGAVKTVLDRLVAKQVLLRSMIGNQYVYAPAAGREEYMRSAVGEIVGSLLATFGEPTYAHFFNQIQSDPEQLARLTALLDEASLRQHDR